MFWNITITFISAIITAWLGFTVVNSMQTNADKLEAKVLRYELVDRFYDSYATFKQLTTEFEMEFIGRYKLLLNKNVNKMSDGERKKLLIDVSNFFYQHKDKWLQMGDSIIPIVSRMHPYFPISAQDSLKDGILKIMVGKFIVNHYHNMEFFDEDYNEMIYSYSMAHNGVIVLNENSREQIKKLVSDLYKDAEKIMSDLNLSAEMSINLTCMSQLIFPSVSKIKMVFNNEMYPKEKEPMSMWRTLLIVLFVGLILYAIAIFCFVGKQNPPTKNIVDRLKEENERLKKEKESIGRDLDLAHTENMKLQDIHFLILKAVKNGSKEDVNYENKFFNALYEIGTFRNENEQLKEIISEKETEINRLKCEVKRALNVNTNDH